MIIDKVIEFILNLCINSPVWQKSNTIQILNAEFREIWWKINSCPFSVDLALNADSLHVDWRYSI